MHLILFPKLNLKRIKLTMAVFLKIKKNENSKVLELVARNNDLSHPVSQLVLDVQLLLSILLVQLDQVVL